MSRHLFTPPSLLRRARPRAHRRRPRLQACDCNIWGLGCCRVAAGSRAQPFVGSAGSRVHVCIYVYMQSMHAFEQALSKQERAKCSDEAPTTRPSNPPS
jgi:hypothetical protein